MQGQLQRSYLPAYIRYQPDAEPTLERLGLPQSIERDLEKVCCFRKCHHGHPEDYTVRIHGHGG